ncbi:MAG: NAD-dependent epimerase/dehydratase family protein [Mariprofundaceae bacterium]|nr:NAD-dependent epimerase/dehydratase family protein [Mariprofundaceae bacterium]
MRRALVTGGGGFLGHAIVHVLQQRGVEVLSFSRCHHDTGSRHICGDICDGQAVADAVSGCDTVFHVAAKAGVWGAWKEYEKINVQGTQHVIDACRTHAVQRLVYTSSPSVIFDGNDMEGVDESVPYPNHYHAHYPKSKAIAERLVCAANKADLATVSLRPHLIWGPNDQHLVPRILAKARKGALRRIGCRPCLVDTIYIDNAAEAHVCAAEHLSVGNALAGRSYFISNGEPIPLWDMVNRILVAGNIPPVNQTISANAAYALGTILEHAYRVLRVKKEPPMTRFIAKELSTAHWFNIAAARRDFNFQPRISIDEGMQRLAQWLQKNENEANVQ